MKDRQHRAVARRVQKFVDVPGSREWTRLRFTIADHRGNDQFGIIECCAARMRENVTEFSAFVNRARCLGRAVTPDTAGKRELLEELAETLEVLTLFGVDLGVCSLEVGGAKHSGSTVSRTGHVNHVEVILLDKPVQMNIDERQSRAGAPMAQQAVLDVFGAKRFR